MARTKKISGLEFLEKVIDKELEIANAPVRFKDLHGKPKEEVGDWYTQYTFKNIDEFNEWKDYFMKTFYEWQPKRVPLRDAEREFSWYNLQYGLKYDFDYDLIWLFKDDLFKRINDFMHERFPEYDHNKIDVQEAKKTLHGYKSQEKHLLKNFDSLFVNKEYNKEEVLNNPCLILNNDSK